MRKIVYLLLLILSFQSFGQNQEIIDSLIIDIKKNKDKYQEIKSLYELSCEYITTFNHSKTDSINKLIIEKLKKNYPNDTLLVETYNLWALSFRNQNQIYKSDSLYLLKKNEAIRLNHRVLENTFLADKNIAFNKLYSGQLNSALKSFDSLETFTIKFDSTKHRDLKILIQFYDNYAIVQANANLLDKALPNFIKVKNINKQLLDKNDLSTIIAYTKALNNLALCYNMLYDSANAIKYYQEALTIATDNKLKNEISLISDNLSGLHLKQNNNDKAIEYARMSLQNEQHPQSSAYSNLGVAYLNKKDFLQAKKFLLINLENVLKTKRQNKIALAYLNLGETYRKLKQKDSAQICLSEALEIYQKIGMIDKITSVNQSLGLLSYEMKEYNKALSYLKIAQKSLDSMENLTFDHFRNSFTQYNCYNQLNDKNNALHYLYAAFEYKESLDSIQNFDKVNELETKYQTKQKENEILQLTNENNEKKAALAQSRLLNFSGAGLLLLLSGIAFFFWHRKKQELKIALLENSMQATELEKKRIGKELHDGIAGTLIKLVKEVEQKDMQLSDKLLSTYNEVRTLSHQLDNTPMHGEVFMDRLIDLIPHNEGDRQFAFKITPISLELKEPIGTHLYRIIQELIANNLKHAQASHTKIYINLEDKVLSLHYEDNGIGIKNLKKNNGFKNIEHRLALIKGKLHISTNLPEGLQIQIDIPYTHEKD